MEAGPAGSSGGDGSPAARRGSASVAIVAGIVIPIIAAPLVAVAAPIGLMASWWLLGELLGQPISWADRQRGGMEMMASAVGIAAVGTIAAALAGVPLVKFLFRRARPDILFRVGAVGMLLLATGAWLWSTRDHPDLRFSAGWMALLGWLGSLIGLKFAAWETEEGRSARAAEDARIAEERTKAADAFLREQGEFLDSDPEGREAR